MRLQPLGHPSRRQRFYHTSSQRTDSSELGIIQLSMSSKIFFKWLPPYLAIWAGLFFFRNAWVTLIAFHAAILLVLFIAQPKISPSLLFKSNNVKWILLNVVLCGLSGFGVYFLRTVFDISDDLSSKLAQIGLNNSTWPGFIAYFSLVNPLIEEYFWRVYLGSTIKGIHVVDLIYAGYHALILIDKVSVTATLFAIACLTFAGWFWRQTKREDNGLLAPVLGHMAADFSICMAIYLLVK